MGRLAGLLGAVAGVGFLSVSLRADACECIEQPPALLFPPPGTAAPRDTPIVIQDPLYPAPGSFAVERVDGTPVPVDEARLELTPQCVPRPVFLRPRELLEPGATYRVVLSPAGDAAPAVAAEFTVTDTLRRVEPLALTIGHVRSVSPPCASCDDVTEVYVDGPVGNEPLWLSVKGSGRTWSSEWVAPLTDMPWTREVAVSTAPSEPCIDFAVIDVTGEAALARRLCDPSRCEVSDSFSTSSCGGMVAKGMDYWRQIPEGSCDSLTFDAGAPVTPPVWAPPPEPASTVPEAGADPNEAHGDQRSEGHESTGCAVGGHGRGGARSVLTALVLAGLALRRRQGHPPTVCVAVGHSPQPSPLISTPR